MSMEKKHDKNILNYIDARSVIRGQHFLGQDAGAPAADAANATISQETPADAAGAVNAATDQSTLPAPTQQTTAPAGEGGASGNVDSALSIANQAFLALQQRQFRPALDLYKNAAGSNPEYQKMVNFTQAILDRVKEIMDDQIQLYAKTMSTNFKMESLTRDEINKMLAASMKQLKAGQQLGDVAIISEIPVIELGLDFQGADQMTLSEYLGWVRPRSVSQRIWQRARGRTLDRQLIFAKMEILQQQRQEKLSRIEDYRRRRLERQGGGLSGAVSGGGGMMGGGMGGMGGGMGGMGGGFGGMGGGMGGF